MTTEKNSKMTAEKIYLFIFFNSENDVEIFGVFYLKLQFLLSFNVESLSYYGTYMQNLAKKWMTFLN